LGEKLHKLLEVMLEACGSCYMLEAHIAYTVSFTEVAHFVLCSGNVINASGAIGLEQKKF